MKKILLMEVKKINKVLTAVGNPFLNNELKKENNMQVIENDVVYQEGIFEILQINKDIDYIIISQTILGNLGGDEIVEKIKEYNSKIKIIFILQKSDENLNNILLKKGVYRIFLNKKIDVKDIIKIISEDNKMEKYNEEIRKEINELKEYIKNNKIQKNNSKKIINKNYLRKKLDNYLNKINIINKIKNMKFLINKNNKIIKNILLNKNKEIISVLGNSGAGKSVFSVMIATILKKYYKKILIIDFDILNNSLHTILGVKKYPDEIKKIMNENKYDKKIDINNLIININKKIDLISGINLIFDYKNKISCEKMKNILLMLKEKYNLIIIDTTSECFFEYTQELIKISDKSIFLTEANLSEISKSKRLLDIYSNEWKIEKNKIKIIFNKYNKNSIDKKLLNNLYSDYEVLGNIKLKNNYNFFTNKNIEIKNKFFKIYNLKTEKIIN